MLRPVIFLSILSCCALGGCASELLTSDSYSYSVSVVNQTQRPVVNTRIKIGELEQWTGGLIMAGEGGGAGGVWLAQSFNELPSNATFSWEWGDDNAKGLASVNLLVPDVPRPPKNMEVFCCVLHVRILPDETAKLDIRMAYVGMDEQHHEIFSTGKLSKVKYSR